MTQSWEMDTVQVTVDRHMLMQLGIHGVMCRCVGRKDSVGSGQAAQESAAGACQHHGGAGAVGDADCSDLP